MADHGKGKKKTGHNTGDRSGKTAPSMNPGRSGGASPKTSTRKQKLPTRHM